MPDPFERHARSRWEWGREPGRGQQRSAAANDDPQPAPRGRARKNTRDFCRGKPGRPHEITLVRRPYRPGQVCGWVKVGAWRLKPGVKPPARPPKGIPVPKYGLRVPWKFREWVQTGWRWSCIHEYVCGRCGKRLPGRDVFPENCPDLHRNSTPPPVPGPA